jgi:sarcosine oxidase subunit alpha
MTAWRAKGGSLIDRQRPMTFTWGGRTLHAFAGDTLASALLANGESIIGRSFKYHRPRGLIAAGLEEPNAIIQLERGAESIPNLKATQVELYDALTAEPVNAHPSVRFDVLAINSVFKRFIPAAFYYKTFLWPNWNLFEPAIRKTAGLGRVPAAPDPDVYEHRYAHTDLLIVGAGAAGLAAAAEAAKSGKRVMLVEDAPQLGGGLLDCDDEIEGRPASEWLAAAAGRIAKHANVQVLRRTMAFGFYDHGLVGLAERLTDHLPLRSRRGPRQRLWKVRCGQVMLATGAFERPIAFEGNDRPGVMLASAALTYLRRYGVAAGRRIAVCTNNDSAYRVALALHDAGCEIALIADSRGEPGECAAAAEAQGLRLATGSVPLRALGRRRVRRLTISRLDGAGPEQTIRCDAVLTSDGWNPVVHLHSQSGGSLLFDERLKAFLPDRAVQNVISIGAANGELSLDAAIIRARAAANDEPASRSDGFDVGPSPTFADGAAAASRAWLDYQNDVTVGDVQLAARENFRSVEHLKRYTTLGMASDQGKTSNVSAIRTMSHLLGKPAAAIGTTKFRPPFDPVPIGSFAGRSVGENLLPLAQVSAHEAQLALGARMESYGGWNRAAYFSPDGASEVNAVRKEVLGVRGSVGLFEASPLGKIEVKGLDAAEFLHRMYVNNVHSLKAGRCRYGLMLNEHGIVYDDGVFARIANDHFLVGTTSGHAAAIADRFHEWLQCEWPALDVLVENVTSNWAVINLAGPQARKVLSALGTDIQLSPEAFPHMAYREGFVAGVQARIQRVSFSGELSYEVSVPWRYGAALWDAAMLAGREHGIVPFGIEALMVMRIEKGFLHVGSDTDGTTYPQDIGFAEPISKKSDDFVGRRSIMRTDGKRRDRRQLVGLEVADRGGALETGAHVLDARSTAPQRTQGWVTSSAFSPTLNRPAALALVERGRERIGEPVRIWHLGVERRARIADPRFYDPSGERLND